MIFFLLISLVQSQCNIRNQNNSIQTAFMESTYELDITDYFEGDGLNYQVVDPIVDSFTLGQTLNVFLGTSLPINTANVLATSILDSNLCFLTKNDTSYLLVNGVIAANGFYDMGQTQFSLDLSNDCFNLQYFEADEVLITCVNRQNQLLYIYYKISENVMKYTNTNQIITEFISQSLEVYSNFSLITFQQTFIESGSAFLLIYQVENKNLVLVNNRTFQGQYLRVFQGLDDTLFLLNSNQLQITFKNNTKETYYNNYTGMAIQNNANNTNLYGVALSTQQYIQYFLYSSNFKTLYHLIPQQYQDSNVQLFLRDRVLLYISTDVILYYDLGIYIKLLNQQPILNKQMNAIKWDFNLIALFTNNTYYTIQLLNKPILQLYNMTQVEVQATSLNGIQCSITFDITLIKQSDPICPRTSQQTPYNGVREEYPDFYFNLMSDNFVGANIQYSLSSNESTAQLKQMTSSIDNKHELNQIFVGVCSDYPITITQYQNMSTYIQGNLVTISGEIVGIDCELVQSNVIVQLQLSTAIFLYQLDLNYQIVESNEFSLSEFPDLPDNSEIQISLMMNNRLFILIQSDLQLLYAINITDIHQMKVLTQLLKTDTPRNLFKSRESYNNLIFVDNITNVIILQCNTLQIYNAIPYPIQDSTDLQIGLLEEGIYLAIQVDNQSYLYLFNRYLIHPVQIINNLSYITINNINFSQPLLSTFSSNFFYILIATEDQISCQVFQIKKAPFNAQYYLANLNNQINYLSVQNRVYLDQLVLNGDSGQFYVLKVYHQVIAQILPSVYGVQNSFILIQYNASSGIDCSTILSQTIQITNNDIIIQPNNAIAMNVGISFNSLKLQPSQLFTGSIQEYQVNCSSCSELSYSNPIEYMNNLDFRVYSAAINDQNQLYLTSNTSMFIYTDELLELYNTDGICSQLFIEFKTQFPVSICNNQSFYAYNTSSDKTIVLHLNLSIEYFVYQNGIIQFTSESTYYSAYFWIVDNQINYQLINTLSDLLIIQPQPLNISMGTNILSQDCQTYGIIYLNDSFVYDLVTLINYQCTPQNILNNLNYQISEQNYTVISKLNLSLPLHTIELAYQLGYPQGNSIYFIVKSNVQPFLFKSTFLDGQIFNISKICRYYQESLNYRLFVYNDLVINVNYPMNYEYLINVYGDYFSNQQINDPNYQIPIIGYLNYTALQFFQDSQLFLLNGCLVVTYNGTTSTIAKIKNYLQVDITLDRSSNLGVLAINPFSQAYQVVNLDTSFEWWIIVVVLICISLVSLFAFYMCRVYKLKNKEDKPQEMLQELA